MTTTVFGQLIVGPPGSGKSTYCKCISEDLRMVGRNPYIINLDPANDFLPYKAFGDVTKLIDVETVMKKKDLGPNGATLVCMEFLEKHTEWLLDTIIDSIEEEKKRGLEIAKELNQGDDKVKIEKPYLIFDCPGQSELYTHHKALRNIIKKITTKNAAFDLRLVCINLCDAHYASDINKYIGVILNSLSTMLNLELPHINVLSKVDLLEKNGKTKFKLDYFTEVLDLKYLLDSYEDDPFHAKYRRLTESIIGTIEDYSLVTFVPLNIRKPEDVYRVLQDADRANGYFIDDLDLAVLQANPHLMEMMSGRRATHPES